VPIVAMTAHALRGDRERCLAAGMDSYISKPIHAKELFATLEQLLGAPKTPSPTPGQLLATQPPLDWEKALEAVGGDPSLVVLVAETALEEAPRLLKSLEEAIAQQDAGASRLAAHTLQGAIRYFGPTSAFDQVCLLETCAREGRLEEATGMLACLREEMGRLLDSLRRYVSEAVPHGSL